MITAEEYDIKTAMERGLHVGRYEAILILILYKKGIEISKIADTFDLNVKEIEELVKQGKYLL